MPSLVRETFDTMALARRLRLVMRQTVGLCRPRDGGGIIPFVVRRRPVALDDLSVARLPDAYAVHPREFLHRDVTAEVFEREFLVVLSPDDFAEALCEQGYRIGSEKPVTP